MVLIGYSFVFVYPRCVFGVSIKFGVMSNLLSMYSVDKGLFVNVISWIVVLVSSNLCRILLLQF